ncbi:hypothetical protein [Bacteroides sp. 519]|uniref:hypothetical protein n=1 Tax=Bacteroides sp. 519 TaxID=2302937 RepID=UPI0019402B85|nr:hypothetical protein [Bacteroides sp. 519]NDV59754.1 hypothetical protein [Bacteroides sp. 519]
MKRFAANYIYIPEYGFLKQYVVEEKGDGILLFPLTEEIEAVSWMQGIICLLPVTEEVQTVLNPEFYSNKQVQGNASDIPVLSEVRIIQIYPFDFTLTQPQKNSQLIIL